MGIRIEYRNEADEVVHLAVTKSGVTRDEAVVLAQRYLGQHRAADRAHVFTEATETVVSRSTRWR